MLNFCSATGLGIGLSEGLLAPDLDFVFSESWLEGCDKFWVLGAYSSTGLVRIVEIE